MSCIPSPLIIAIDGPSGSGKTTVGRKIARELGLLYLDTGSMYRAVALAVMNAGIDSADCEAVGSLATNIQIDLEGDPDSLKVYLQGRDVTEDVRSEDVTHMSSIISAIPAVRRAMVSRQREMAKRGAVLNGRDIGTVVFPDANVKFFLTASPKERARRRFKETDVANASFKEVMAEMTERDMRDSTRGDSPLAVASDAVVIDSTGLSIDEVAQKMITIVREKIRSKE